MFIKGLFIPSVSGNTCVDAAWKNIMDLYLYHSHQVSAIMLALMGSRPIPKLNADAGSEQGLRFLSHTKKVHHAKRLCKELYCRDVCFALVSRLVWTRLRYFFRRIEEMFCRMLHVFAVRRLTVYSSIFLLTTNAQHFTNIFPVNNTGFFAHQCNYGISRTRTHTRTHLYKHVHTIDRVPTSTRKRENERSFLSVREKSGKKCYQKFREKSVNFWSVKENSYMPVISMEFLAWFASFIWIDKHINYEFLGLVNKSGRNSRNTGIVRE